jgi:hypothetical protein
MISSKLNGGLGNVLFQIAAAYTLALNHNDTCAFDFSSSPVYQGNTYKTYRNNIFKKLKDLPAKWRPDCIYKEKGCLYRPIPYNKSLMLMGYFSGDKYIGNRRKEVLDLFLDRGILDNLKYGFNGILSNSVSLHIRRGDYLKFKDVYIQLGVDYYQRALEIIREKAQVDHVLVFSDDIGWCKDNIKMSNVYFSEFLPDFCDLFLMSLCSHNVMANSSFSWWGSYLNENPYKIIIAPEEWFIKEGQSLGRPENSEHAVCDNWIRI